jgi:hypothetical protein
MAGKIFAITTHHKHSKEAAEEWKRLGICAIGWAPINLCKCRSVEEIKKRLRREDYGTMKAKQIWCFVKRISKGDIILAYSRGKTIAYVGEVKDNRCRLNQKNIIGDPDGYDYPNQRRVGWWEEPHHFDCHDLPPYLAKQFGKRGVTVAEIDPSPKGFEEFIEIVKACANSGSKLPGINEDGVKAGLVKYLNHSLEKLEPGLTIKHAEVAIGEQKRAIPDFIAKDRRGRTVLIECKGIAGEASVRQIKDYEKEYSKGENSRLIIFAFRVNKACRLAAKKERNVELVECDLDFQKIEQ